MPDEDDLSLDALGTFLTEARSAGYANIERAAPLRGDDRETILRFEREGWHYVDRFVGGDPFSGLELVLRHRRPVFAMAYYGASESEDPDAVFAFLREALRSGDPRRPRPEATRFEREAWAYEARIAGDLGRFDGQETITNGDSVVYRGWLVGGLVDRRRAI